MTRLRVLQILLIAIGVISVLAGFVLMFATGSIYALLEIPASDFLLIVLKAVGAVSVGIGYATLVAARDPERNVAIVDLLIIISVLAAGIGYYAEIVYHFSAGHVPSWLVWAGASLRLLIAIILLALRPK
jgi:hypothetical protein